jgi:lysozyme family protein
MSTTADSGALPPAPPPAYPPAFTRAAERVLQDEGGYVCDPDDPGGETKWGISKRQYPGLDIKHLTREQAIAIYWRDYWCACRLGEMPAQVGAKLLDLAVLMGPYWAAVCIQRAARACGTPLAEDGVVGPLTLKVCRLAAGDGLAALIAALRSEAAGYFRALAALERGRRPDRDQPFLKQWLNRAYE